MRTNIAHPTNLYPYTLKLFIRLMFHGCMEMWREGGGVGRRAEACEELSAGARAFCGSVTVKSMIE